MPAERERGPSVAEKLDGYPEFENLVMALSNAVHQDDCAESWEETVTALGYLETEIECMARKARAELLCCEDEEEDEEATDAA